MLAAFGSCRLIGILHDSMSRSLLLYPSLPTSVCGGLLMRKKLWRKLLSICPACRNTVRSGKEKRFSSLRLKGTCSWVMWFFLKKKKDVRSARCEVTQPVSTTPLVHKQRLSAEFLTQRDTNTKSEIETTQIQRSGICFLKKIIDWSVR